jgi:hypothetical protein
LVISSPTGEDHLQKSLQGTAQAVLANQGQQADDQGHGERGQEEIRHDDGFQWTATSRERVTQVKMGRNRLEEWPKGGLA